MADPARAAELSLKVASWLQLGGTPAAGDAAALALVAPAVEAWVDGLPGIDRDTAGDWEPTTWLGAVMLGARLVRRRNSPGGIEAFAADGAAYVRTTDPDVATLLHIDKPRPRIG